MADDLIDADKARCVTVKEFLKQGANGGWSGETCGGRSGGFREDRESYHGDVIRLRGVFSAFAPQDTTGAEENPDARRVLKCESDYYRFRFQPRPASPARLEPSRSSVDGSGTWIVRVSLKEGLFGSSPAGL